MSISSSPHPGLAGAAAVQFLQPRMATYAFSSRVVILRIRSCVLIAVVTLGVLWVGLLCLDAYLRGGYRTARESVAVAALLAVNAMSSITIPIFVLLDFSDSNENSRWFSHVRFEVAFMCTHLLLQMSALLFTILYQSFRCDDNSGNADIEGECRLTNVYISIASWLTPLILLSFIVYFSVVSVRTARHFPALWRTAVRYCPWDVKTVLREPKAVGHDFHVSIRPRPRDLEGRTISTVSSPQQSSRESSQFFTPTANSRISLPQRVSQPPPPRTVPGRTVSRHPLSLIPSQKPSCRPNSQPPPSRRASQPLLNRNRFNNTSVRVPPHLPSTRIPSRPLPLRPATTPTIQTPNTLGFPLGQVSPTIHNGLGSSLNRYAEEWHRDRRDLTMHPTWLGKSSR